MRTYSKCKVAALHAAPVFLDKQATAAKAVSLIAEAARKGAEIVAFPETFVSAFPYWAALWAPMYNHDLFRAIIDSSVLVPGPEMAMIAAEARRRQVFVSIGINEKNPASSGGIWNANLLIDDTGKLINHHRKLVPTFFEKLVWTPGDGAGLRVSDTRIGRIGMLICGENTNPLARYALMAQGEQVHISTYPAIWPTKVPQTRENYDNVAANRTRTAAHAFEAKAFCVVSAGFLDKPTRDFLVNRDSNIATVVDETPRAVSMFVDPTGAQMGECLQNEEGIIHAEFDLQACIEPKQYHDIAGSYNRFDVFELRINRKRSSVATWIDDERATFPSLLEEAPEKP